MKLFKLTFAIAMGLFFVTGATAQADTTWTKKTGTGAEERYVSGNWNESANWSAGVPDSSAVATLPDQLNGYAEYVVTMNAATGASKSLAIGTQANLTIGTGKGLQLGSGTSVLTSTIASNGKIVLEGSGSELAIVTVSHTISGDGKVVGQDESAKISVSDGKTLTSSTSIEGAMEVADANNSGTFLNQGKVLANRNNGVLKLTVSTISDSATTGTVNSSNFRWGVNGTGTCELRFEVSPSSLQGSFYVNGILEAGSDLVSGVHVCTTENVLFDAGEIKAGNNCSLSFSGSCS